MTPRQVALVALVAVGLIVLVLELIRRHMMREKYSLLWFFVSLAALSVPLLYNVYARIARLLGIVEVANFFFFLAIVALFLLSLQFTLALSAAYSRTKALIQQLGLLENRVRELEQQCPERGRPESDDGGPAPGLSPTDAPLGRKHRP